MRTLELTLYLPCPILCNYCPQDVLRDNYTGQKEMSLNDLEKYLGMIPKDVRIDLSGMSESLLYTHFVELIRILENNKLNYCVYTTLFGITEEKLEALRNYPPNPFVIHVPDVSMRLKINESYLEFFDKISESNNPPLTHYACFDSPQDGIKINKNYDPHSRAGNNKEIYTSVKNGKAHCSLSKDFDHNVLLPNGDIILCCMDYGLTGRLGNLNDNSYEEIRNNIGDVNKKICGSCIY